MDLLIAGLNSVGIVAFCSLLDMRFWGVAGRGAVKNILTGMLFGAGALIAMVQPIYGFENYQADMRYLFIAFSFVFGGLTSGLVTMLAVLGLSWILAPEHIWLYLAFASLVAILSYAWTCATKMQISVIRRRSWGAWLVLALIVSLPNAAFPYDDSLRAAQALILHIALNITCILLFGRLIESEYRRNARMNELNLEARIDVLTGLPNRRAFMDYVEFNLPKNAESVSLILLDIDHFKSFNDSFGHGFGDDVLRIVGHTIQQSLREQDFAARIGGEEFALIVVNASEAESFAIAERLRNRLFRKLEFQGKSILLSASFGGATLGRDDFNFAQAFSLSDEALYRAKALGRNRTAFTQIEYPLGEELMAEVSLTSAA